MNTSKNISPLEIRLTEIGRVHSPFKQATGTPIQPYRAGSAPGYIALRPEFVDGLADLDGFDRVWLIYWFHCASSAKMIVIPYRDTVAHGLFATRVPARPNTIGMSCVRLLNIEGNILRLAELDILDDTPPARHQALCAAIRQLSGATLRMAGHRAGQTRRRR
jgi:tRNA-Thr(GGU) m(6)t(6)A37 methyltransferase TsaA